MEFSKKDQGNRYDALLTSSWLSFCQGLARDRTKFRDHRLRNCLFFTYQTHVDEEKNCSNDFQYHSNDDDQSISVQHALSLIDGSATTEEGDDRYTDPYDDDENGDPVWSLKYILKILGFDEDKDSCYEESQTNDEKGKVEEEESVLHTFVSTSSYHDVYSNR